MISPQDYPVFYQDVNNKQSSIYPIAILGWDSVSKTPLPNAIFISTKPENIDVPYTYNENGIADSWVEENFIDADMKVSKVKHSISIESRNFKISNVTITFSNYSNLSDLLANFNLTNLEVALFYKSQSCTSVDQCLPMYIANVRRYDNTSKSIKITLEDSTQEKIAKEIPIANIGTDQSKAYSPKYYNKYVPITYGYFGEYVSQNNETFYER